MAIQKILFPYNFGHTDQSALNFVIETFAHLKDVEVTIFNAYTEIPAIDTSASSVTGKLKGSMSYLSQKISEQEKELDGVKQKLIGAGFTESKVQSVFKPRKKDIASEIIALAVENQYDAVVLNRKHARVTRFFSGSISNKVVMALKGTVVCIVS